MNRTANSVKMANQLSGRVIPLLFVALGLPLVVLVGFGLFAIYQNDYLLYFIALLALSTVVGVVPLLWLKKEASQILTTNMDDSLVKASSAWSEWDNQVWLKLNEDINRQLMKSAEWGDLKEYGLELITLTCEQYNNKNNNRKEFAFTAPELLIMVEEISRRYRHILKTHVPFIEKVNLSTFKMFYDHKDKALIAKNAWDVYRAYRAFTPTGLITEARGQLLSKAFGGVGDEVQIKLKQALLQEVVSVAIDLYSGRFKVTDDELEQSQVALKDKKRMAKALEPLRICLLGQISSGKSTLVNELTNSMVAEVSKLPSTNEIEVHQCSVEGIETLHIVDLPGLDADNKTEKYLLEQVVNSDLVIWVLKANQQARALDTQFKTKLDEFYAETQNRSRKRPIIIGVLNQVDRLKPVNEWQPPYNLDNATSAKAKTINNAIEYNQELLTLDYLIPLSLSDDKEQFNILALKSLLDQQYEYGIQVQLNRRRIESGDKLELTEQAKRIYRAGKSLFGIVVK